MLTLTVSKINFPNNQPIASPISVDLYIKPYYQDDSAYELIESNVSVDVNGNVLASPLPAIPIDPTEQYVLKVVNDSCDTYWVQDLVLYPYCPSGYTLASDGSSCYYMETVSATPPTSSQNAQSIVGPNNYYYGIFGTLIFNAGYAPDGTGTFTQIPYSNAFWVNGPGYPHFPSTSQVLGPMNRTAIWSPTVAAPQQIGFSVCLDLEEDGIYYVGFGCDDFGSVVIDGNTIISQNKVTLLAYLQANGYLYPGGLDTNQVCFDFWFVYPVQLTSGQHVIEIIGNNVSGTVYGAAAVGCEVYNLTPAQIAAATSYAVMGSGLVFSSKDFVGQPIQLGTGGVGYTCPANYSLKFCDSPPSCVRIVTTPVLY